MSIRRTALWGRAAMPTVALALLSPVVRIEDHPDRSLLQFGWILPRACSPGTAAVPVCHDSIFLQLVESPPKSVRFNPRITPYSPQASRIRSAVELASDVEGLRLVLGSVLGERYRVRVSDDGSVVGLWGR